MESKLYDLQEKIQKKISNTVFAVVNVEEKKIRLAFKEKVNITDLMKIVEKAKLKSKLKRIVVECGVVISHKNSKEIDRLVIVEMFFSW